MSEVWCRQDTFTLCWEQIQQSTQPLDCIFQFYIRWLGYLGSVDTTKRSAASQSMSTTVCSHWGSGKPLHFGGERGTVTQTMAKSREVTFIRALWLSFIYTHTAPMVLVTSWSSAWFAGKASYRLCHWWGKTPYESFDVPRPFRKHIACSRDGDTLTG